MFNGSWLFDTIYRMSIKRGSCCLVAVCTVWTVLCWCLLYAGRVCTGRTEGGADAMERAAVLTIYKY